MPCSNHPQRAETWYCPQCNVGFCPDCVDVKMYGHVKVEVCPKCRDKVLSVQQYQAPEPFWNRLPEIFQYPFQDEGWMRIAVVGVMAVVLLGLGQIGMMMGGLLGAMGAMGLRLIYSGIIISYFYLVISRSEAGDTKPPGWSAISGIYDLIWPTLQFMLTTLVVFMPVLVFLFILLGAKGFDWGHWAASLKTPPVLAALGLLGLLGLAILPMGLLLLGVFRTVMNAWNPIIIFGQIMKIPKEYLAALGFMIVLETVSVIVWVGLRFVDLALGGGFFAGVLKYFIAGAVDFYFLIVAGHMLGYLAYQCRFELGWWHDTAVRPVPPGREPAPVARPEAHPDLMEGFRSLKGRAFERAEASFQAVLKDEPENPEAARGLLDLARERGDESGVAFWGNKSLDFALRRGDSEGAHATFQEIRAAFPALALDPRIMIALAKGLREKEKYYEAAAVLRQFAVAFPDDSRAPKALYQCGELLLKYANQPENARKILDYILQRYPNSELAPHVQGLLKQIQTP